MASKTGINHNDSKLTKSQVLEIRATLSTQSNRHYALKYGVSDSAISLIRSGKTWKNV